MSSSDSEGSARSAVCEPMPRMSAAPYSTALLLDTSAANASLTVSPWTANCKSTQAVSSVSPTSSYTSAMQLSRAEVLARTVHLRCLPPFMKQKILADVFEDCGEYLRVRICGNAATHQKWVYGFVEFASADAAAKMLTYSGMELPNGPEKPPLRLKCSPSKQPILDCMAYDADVVSGTPCGFGRGYLAECALNDALLVVGNGGGATAPSGAGGASSNGAGDRRTRAANNALTALTVRSIRKVAATGCGCGCSGVNCCGCCSCWKGLPESSEGAACAGGEISPNGTFKGPAGAVAPTVAFGGCTDGASGDAGFAMTMSTSDCCGASATTLTQLTATRATLESLHTPLASSDGGSPADIMVQLATAFEGLRSSAVAHERQLDGLWIGRQAEAIVLEVIYHASQPTCETRVQDTLREVTQLLAFLDSNAAMTGGAAQTACGDGAAALPQRVTKLRMLANLVGALLCLLHRSVADAIPYVEAVLVTFAQIPPSSLLRRARLQGNAVAVQKQCRAQKAQHSQVLGRYCEGTGPGTTAGAGNTPALCSLVKKRRPAPPLRLGAFVDEDVAESLLEMLEEDEDGENDGGICEEKDIRHVSDCEGPLKDDNLENKGDDVALRQGRSGSSGSCSDASAAFLGSADMADLYRRDEAFSRYVLNVVVSVGLSMEEVYPVIARSAYSLANARAAEVLGESNKLLADCLAATPTGSPRLCAALFEEARRGGSVCDVTFFPRLFFESANMALQGVRDTRETEGFWSQLPPNHVVTLFKA
ncbi:hypothetical protein LSCM4_03190 [Leishmania orientalis]|uniref:RRM domain-containing protein n=1 Tax=Leishmania orientalis TaxID=2249476 RepID=A0A836GGC6_9TRYP|nr:hypothetical protein LSCM4_03190 [Leishmania orientalis]